MLCKDTFAYVSTCDGCSVSLKHEICNDGRVLMSPSFKEQATLDVIATNFQVSASSRGSSQANHVSSPVLRSPSELTIFHTICTCRHSICSPTKARRLGDHWPPLDTGRFLALVTSSGCARAYSTLSSSESLCDFSDDISSFGDCIR